ncbi:MAG: hypothetical protein P8J33_11645, partial [Pirellulaceae bacterium]|nr:hypothetical protein [Pirellulaceae bacterium]
IGLVVLTVLMAIFLYVAFGKLSGWNAPNPTAFQGQTRVTLADVPNAPTSELPTDPAPRTVQIASENPALDSPTSASISDPKKFVSSEPYTLIAGAGGESSPSPNFQIPIRPPQENEVSQIPTEPLDTSVVLPTTGDSVVRPVGQFEPVKLPEKQSVQEESKAVPERSDQDESANQKPNLPWNLKLPTFGGPTKKSTVPASNAKNASADPGPQVKTASSSSFIPGRSVSSSPKPASLEPPRTSSMEPPFQPKANEPSLAVGEIPDAAPLPALPATTLVEQGEGFWLVAQRVYGDGRYFDALFQANRKRVKSFNEVAEGTEILTPSTNELRKRWPYLCPRKVFKTSGGETLFDIASEQLGQASRYVEILKLNRSRLPKSTTQATPLKAGISLELPNLR